MTGDQILCPRCPRCDRPPETGITPFTWPDQAWCGNDDCTALNWAPLHSRADNLAHETIINMDDLKGSTE